MNFLRYFFSFICVEIKIAKFFTYNYEKCHDNAFFLSLYGIPLITRTEKKAASQEGNSFCFYRVISVLACYDFVNHVSSIYCRIVTILKVFVYVSIKISFSCIGYVEVFVYPTGCAFN